MSLHTFEVPYVCGKVRFVTSKNSGHDVTVECYDLNTAFLIRHEGRTPMKIGDWVRVRGKVRFDPGLNSDGSLREQNLSYYHEPADGSPRDHWWFFNLLESDYAQLGPPGSMEKIQNAMVSLRRHLDSWNANNNYDDLWNTMRSLDAAKEVLGSELRKRTAERDEAAIPVATLEIEID